MLLFMPLTVGTVALIIKQYLKIVQMTNSNDLNQYYEGRGQKRVLKWGKSEITEI